MTERDDQSIDNELSGVAMAAIHEHESSVSAHETEAALEAVLSRVAGGDLGGAPPSIPLTSTTGGRRSPWVRLGAVAAAVSMVALGLVAVVGGGSSTDIVTPATVPATPDPVTAPPSTAITTMPAAEATATTTTTTTSTIAAESTFERQVIGVDALDPPRLVQPVPYFTLPLEPNPQGALIEFAVGADHVVVNQPDTGSVTIVGPDVDGVSARDVPVEEDLGSIVSGPGSVIYGFGDLVFDEGSVSVPQGRRFVAIPFLGENEGQVVAAEERDLNAYLEIPRYFFGHGPGGIISRGRDGATVFGYVDEAGLPRDSGEAAENGTPFPVFEFGPDVEGLGSIDDNPIQVEGTDVSWQLDIARDPGSAGLPFVGSNVVAPGARRAIYTERIGADTRPDLDFGPNAMPVVALLNYDGTGEWIRLPEDWEVVASDVWGTLLARITDDTIELASLEDLVPTTGPSAPAPNEADPVASTVTTTDAPSTATPTTTVTLAEPDGLVQPTAIVRTCVGDFVCTDLANTPSGRIVGFDRGVDQNDDVLRVYNAEGTELQAEISIAEPLDSPYLWAVGPDDVAYLQTVPPDAGEAAGELLAIPLVGSNAGSVVMRWTGLSVSGDSTLIPRKAGLTSVGCCGPKETRPSPDATIYRWVDRSGATIDSTAPSFDLNLGSAGNSLTRIDTAADGSPLFSNFTLPLVYQYPRDFPWVTATGNGGALAYDEVQLQSGAYEVFVQFDTDWAAANVDNGDVYFRRPLEVSHRPLLEPSGTVIVADGPSNGDPFVRRNLDEIATRGWPGRTAIDVDTFTVAAPGLNDYITAEQPFWAEDAELLAVQLAPALGDSEEVRIEFDDVEAPVLTITTTGLLDDSVTASRMVVTTRRGSDGLLRFVSADTSFQCAPNRGHQDFSIELCL